MNFEICVKKILYIPKNYVFSPSQNFVLWKNKLKTIILLQIILLVSKMPSYYINKWIVNIKMTSIYNKLWNKQDELFFSRSSHFKMGQGSWNEF